MNNFKVDDLLLCTKVRPAGKGYIEEGKVYVVAPNGNIKPLMDSVWVDGGRVHSGVSEITGVFKKI